MVTTRLDIKRQTVTLDRVKYPPSSAFPRARASSISPDANRLAAIDKKNDRYLIRSHLRLPSTNASRQHDDRHERRIVPRPQQIGSWTGERPLPTLTLAGTWLLCTGVVLRSSRDVTSLFLQGPIVTMHCSFPLVCTNHRSSSCCSGTSVTTAGKLLILSMLGVSFIRSNTVRHFGCLTRQRRISC